MRQAHRVSLLILILVGMGASVFAQGKGGEDLTGPYDVVPNWPQPLQNNDGWTFGGTYAVWAESPDRIWVLQRGEVRSEEKSAGEYAEPRMSATLMEARNNRVLMVLDRDGKLVDSWEHVNDMLVAPHRVTMDPNDPARSVWLVDQDGHQVLKFSHDGNLLVALGEKNVRGNGQTHFNRPTDIAFLPNGDLYIAELGRGTDDRDGNNRVVKFSRDGKYLSEWDTSGGGPGESGEPPSIHSIAIDAQQRIYLADRANQRMLVFDEERRFLDQWPNLPAPDYVRVSNDQSIWVSDGETNRFLKFDTGGKLLYSWGTRGDFPGGLWRPHMFSVDSDGNLYVADTYNGRAQKFRPRQGANPDLLIHP